MRKIEKKMIAAVKAGLDFHQDNTTVNVLRDNAGRLAEIRVRLWGNLIYRQKAGRAPRFSTCGYNTNTTRSRLQALGCNCHIERGQMVNCETRRPIFAGCLL